MRQNYYSNREIVSVSLDEIFIPERSIERIMRKDHAQIERLRLEYENDYGVFRVELRPRIGGGYIIQDGRHRVIAAKLAGVGFIEAVIVGDEA
ncbi:MAG: hypothetical protein K2X27_26040 [Candidatus Obscuribacterales bacterium]|nr:hypothetical protein [Candidatus Obscuribacterales bacterium]